MNYIFRYADGHTEAHSENDIINNAMEQEAAGIVPRYRLNIDYNAHSHINPSCGWLVWSTWGGCGVVFKNKDGNYSIIEGVQGDFIYCMG